MKSFSSSPDPEKAINNTCASDKKEQRLSQIKKTSPPIPQGTTSLQDQGGTTSARDQGESTSTPDQDAATSVLGTTSSPDVEEKDVISR